MLIVTKELTAKPLIIVVENVIGSSKFAGQVVIIGYDVKGQISFKSTEYQDTISVAKVGIQLENEYDISNKLSQNYWTGNYPPIGDTVFIVVNENDNIRIFGKQVGNDYRLWSPLITGSIAIFEFIKPLKPVDSTMVLGVKGQTSSCWDGCLIPISLTNSLVSESLLSGKNKNKNRVS